MQLVKNGNVIIQKKIDETVKQGLNRVVINGNYEISDTIYLPSNITLVLEDCHLIMADGTFCNMFKNVDLTNDNRDFESPDTNIRIIGSGRAILDGGNYNGLCEGNSRKDGMPHISNNWLIFFCNVENFEIDNIEVRNQRHWAMTFYSCRYGKISNVNVLADYSRIDENGNVIKGLKKEFYAQTRAKNADGIDIRIGCHDILIENITGFTEDDTVAVTSLFSEYSKKMKWFVGDGIYNVIIKNIRSATFCSNVRLLNQGGAKLYNVLIDGVMAQRGEKYMENQCGSSVKIGDTRLYGSRHSTKDETYNICVNNVFGFAKSLLYLAGEMADCTFTNIFGAEGCTLVENYATCVSNKK